MFYAGARRGANELLGAIFRRSALRYAVLG